MSKLAETMIKVVLDTNCSVSGMLWEGVAQQVIRLARTRLIVICTSPKALREFERVVSYPRIHQQVSRRFFSVNAIVRDYAMLARCFDTEYIEPGKVFIKEDPDDDEFLRIALASRTRIVVSQDKHLVSLARWNHVSIVRPEIFMTAYRRGSKKVAETSLGRWRIWAS